mmetsp:Transcript_22342/g.50468  ORF Transcript_22342/g.50468 Transcript_22342/m.50468 type:complete len:215 (+) Transcript_22342:180-824(+)
MLSAPTTVHIIEPHSAPSSARSDMLSSRFACGASATRRAGRNERAGPSFPPNSGLRTRSSKRANRTLRSSTARLPLRSSSGSSSAGSSSGAQRGERPGERLSTKPSAVAIIPRKLSIQRVSPPSTKVVNTTTAEVAATRLLRWGEAAPLASANAMAPRSPAKTRKAVSRPEKDSAEPRKKLASIVSGGTTSARTVGTITTAKTTNLARASSKMP